VTSSNNEKIGIGARWSSYWAFIFAAVGSSIGLGNIWKFPYEMGEHGGGTFLLIYIPSVLLVAFPLMMAELMIGRRGRSNPIHSIDLIAKQDKISPLWQSIGWLGILTGFLIFSYFSVVSSWILFYIMKSLSGSFVDIPAEVVQNSFGALLHNSDQMLIWHTVFVLMIILVLARGWQQGLNRALRWLTPCFIALLVWLCVYASQVGDYQSALEFMTTVNLGAINAELIVSAVSQALFSMGIGMGVMIMYGAYLRKGRSIVTAATVVMIFDTGIALLMGVLIFSIVFAFGMQPDAGFGLIFQTLPVAFSQITSYSVLWSALFFSLVLIAALMSALTLLEPVVVWIEDQFGASRRLASWLVGALAWGAGWLSVYSFSDYSFNFYYFSVEKEYGFFDLFNILTTHVLLPTTALLIAIFSAWRLISSKSQKELAWRFVWRYKLWRFCTRYVTPFIIVAVLFIVLFLPG